MGMKPIGMHIIVHHSENIFIFNACVKRKGQTKEVKELRDESRREQLCRESFSSDLRTSPHLTCIGCTDYCPPRSSDCQYYPTLNFSPIFHLLIKKFLQILFFLYLHLCTHAVHLCTPAVHLCTPTVHNRPVHKRCACA